MPFPPLDHNIYASATTLYQISGYWEWFRQNWLVKIDPITGTQTKIPLASEVRNLCFTAIGTLYGTSTNGIVQLDSNTGIITTICTTPPLSRLAIRSDGTFYILTTDKSFYKINIDDGSLIYLSDLANAEMDDLEFNSDGTLFVWIYGGCLRILNLSNFAITPYNDYHYTHGNVYQIALIPDLIPPVIALSCSNTKINTNTSGGDSTGVTLSVNQTGGETPDTATLYFGDGTSINLSLPLPQTITHNYSLTCGDNSKTFAASVLADSYTDGGATANITILRQPKIVLSVNGLSVEEGNTIKINIREEPVLNLSLVNSLGYIEKAEFIISSKGLDVSGTNLTYSGALFDQSNIGKVFPLLASVSNSGSGVNTDTIIVNLRIVASSGDANLDNKVDVGDLGILAANYGKTGNCTWAMGDFNGDGNVDCGDLGILAANYGTGTSGADYNADYAKVFGTTTKSDVDAGKTNATTDEDTSSAVCSGLGLPLVMCILMNVLLLGNSFKLKE